ncbi:hypothetical protein HYY27_05360 [bacterium]|nr:hypothetical protein [bacterium]
MKPFIIVLTFALASLPGSALAQNASVRDYTVPVSSAKNLQFDFAFTYSATGSTVTSKNGNLILFYKKFYDSLPFAYSLDLSGSALLNRLNPQGDFNQNGRVDAPDAALMANYLYLKGGLGATRADTARFNPTFDLTKDGTTDSTDVQAFLRRLGEKAKDDLTYKSQFSSRGKKYLHSGSKIFGFGDFNLRYSDTFDRPDTDVTPGLGYGRFISATPLAKAVRIEEFLLREKAISDHLPKEHLVALGHVIQREGEFRDRYGSTYRKWWFEAMESVIVASGMAPDGIGAGGILRINEVLFEQRVNERFYGWEASAGVNFQVASPLKTQPRRDPGAAIGIRYARPIGWKHQVSGRVDLSSPFTEQFGKVYKLSFTEDYIYEVSNRIDFILRDALALDIRARPPSVGAGPFNKHLVSNALSAAFIFFVENKTNFSVNAQFDKVESQPLLQSFSATLNYRIF